MLTVAAVSVLCVAFFRQNNRYEIAESIRLIPAEEVPFPTVLVDAGDNLDPMGYVKAAKSMVGEEDIDEKGMWQLFVEGS